MTVFAFIAALLAKRANGISIRLTGRPFAIRLTTPHALVAIMLYNDFCRSSFAHKKKTLIFVILLFLEIVFMERSLRNILGAKAQQSVDITISWYCEKGRDTYLCWRISFSKHCTWHEDTFPGLGWTCTSANWWRDGHPAWNQCPLPRQDSQRRSGPGEKMAVVLEITVKEDLGTMIKPNTN